MRKCLFIHSILSNIWFSSGRIRNRANEIDLVTEGFLAITFSCTNTLAKPKVCHHAWLHSRIGTILLRIKLSSFLNNLVLHRSLVCGLICVWGYRHKSKRLNAFPIFRITSYMSNLMQSLQRHRVKALMAMALYTTMSYTSISAIELCRSDCWHLDLIHPRVIRLALYNRKKSLRAGTRAGGSESHPTGGSFSPPTHRCFSSKKWETSSVVGGVWGVWMYCGWVKGGCWAYHLLISFLMFASSTVRWGGSCDLNDLHSRESEQLHLLWPDGEESIWLPRQKVSWARRIHYLC